MYHFFAYIARMRYIDRWALMRNTEKESIQEHSHEVAVLAHALATIRNTYFGGNVDVGKVTVAALYHDASEILTGDLPTPIKYFNPTIRDSYKQIESDANDKLLSNLPQEMCEAYRTVLNPEEETEAIVKAADKLSAHIKCLEELKAGNMEFLKASKQTEEALNAMHLPELEYFKNHFLPSYKLTLDELD